MTGYPPNFKSLIYKHMIYIEAPYLPLEVNGKLELLDLY